MNTLEHAVALVSAESGTVIKWNICRASLIHDMQGPGRREALRSEVMSAASRPLEADDRGDGGEGLPGGAAPLPDQDRSDQETGCLTAHVL